MPPGVPRRNWPNLIVPTATAMPASTRTSGAQRAERQAADAVRRKAERQRGSAVAVLDDEPQARIPQRVIKGLVAMTIVALGVLGVYTVVSPETAETSATSPAVASAGPAVTPEVDALPDLPTAPQQVGLAQVPHCPATPGPHPGTCGGDVPPRTSPPQVHGHHHRRPGTSRGCAGTSGR